MPQRSSAGAFWAQSQQSEPSMYGIRGLVLALACVVASGSAHADRFRLDDDVAERGECELEVAAERLSAKDAAAETAGLVQLDCGIGWRTELVATFVGASGGEGRAQAFELEARTLILAKGIAGSTWSLLYGAGIERSAGQSWRGSNQFVAVEAAWRPADAWVAEAQVGAAYDRIDRQRVWQAQVAVEHEFSDLLDARVELADSNRNRPVAAVEVRYEFWPDRARVNLSYAARSGGDRERLAGVGISFEW
jgi:hypothetical protein